MNDFPLIELREVSLKTTESSGYILKDISFKINQGDRLAIVGASGAGKTTLLRLLNNLQTPSQGLILLENIAYNSIPVIKLRRDIVLVLQEAKLLGMTVEKSLAYPLVLQQLSPEEINNRIKKWCNRIGILAEWLDRNELQLSVGQRQLVSIARGIIMEPKVLILDEPTSALDTGRANALIETLIKITQTKETTIIMVNHQLELAKKFANRAIYLEQGQIIKDNLITKINWEQIKETLITNEAKTREQWD